MMSPPSSMLSTYGSTTKVIFYLSLLVSSDLTIWRVNWRNFGDRFERFIERFLFSNCPHTPLICCVPNISIMKFSEFGFGYYLIF